MQIIGISGKAETGKDYLFSNILRPRGYVAIAFAAHMKINLIAHPRRGHTLTYEEAFVTKPPVARRMMQLEGTEEGWQQYGERLWVDHALAWCQYHADVNRITHFCIPDVRFPHEVQALRELGHKVIRIHAPERAANSRLSPEARAHASETALDDWTEWDGIIQNNPGAKPLGAQFDVLNVKWAQLPIEGIL